MRKKIYVIFPIVIFAILMLHAFFGHLMFASPSDKAINKYSIYIHLQKEWNSYPGNLLFDVTDVWKNSDSQNPLREIYYDPEISKQEFKDHNLNVLDYQRGKSFVELKHEFSDCNESWSPISYRYIVDTIRNRFEFFQGNELKGDPYASVYPKISNEQYGLDEQDEKLKSGYAQFIPICTSKNSTNIEYSLKINSNQIGFDVYFVPYIDELSNYLEGNSSFSYYNQDGCSGKNFQSFNGICRNVGNQSGLLVVIPDELHLALTKITVNLIEI